MAIRPYRIFACDDVVHLCAKCAITLPFAKNYCSRYRPAARESQAPDTGTTHIGFRLII